MCVNQEGSVDTHGENDIAISLFILVHTSWWGGGERDSGHELIYGR